MILDDLSNCESEVAMSDPSGSAVSCIVCEQDGINAKQGVVCSAEPSEEDETPHFVCDDCFEMVVATECAKDVNELRQQVCKPIASSVRTLHDNNRGGCVAVEC